MKKLILCPVCGNQIEEDSDYEQGCLLEQSAECAKCGYSFTYCYGYTQARVGGETFEWGYLEFADYEAERKAFYHAVHEANVKHAKLSDHSQAGTEVPVQ